MQLRLGFFIICYFAAQYKLDNIWFAIFTRFTCFTVTFITYNTEFYSPQTIVDASSLNVSSGVAGNVIANLFQKAELHGVRERITKNRNSGTTLKEKLAVCKSVTAGKLFMAGSCRLGKDLEMEVTNRHIKKLDQTKAAKNKKIDKVRKLRREVDNIKLTGVQIEDMNVAQLKSMVTYYKSKEDGKTPSRKSDLINMLTDIHAKGIGSPTCSPVTSDVEDNEDKNESSDDESVGNIVAV
jgi:hypothetical protein